MIILGIDPSLQNTGWGLLSFEDNKLVFIDCNTITTNSEMSIETRIFRIHEALTKVIKEYRPITSAIEETFVNKNPLTSLKLAHARGSVMLTLAINNISLAEYAPNLVKKTIVGAGRAEKEQIAAMIKILLPKSKFKNDHESDALAVAICHSRFIKSI